MPRPRFPTAPPRLNNNKFKIMKFIIEQRTLVDPLRKLASTAPDVASLSSTAAGSDAVNAVSSILIEPRENGVRFTATDNTLRLAFQVPVEGEDLKPCTVPASTLLHICSRFPADAEIRFELQEDGKAMSLSHGRSRYKLVVVDADEFPGIVAQEDEHELSLPEGSLLSQLASVRYAMAQNDMRYYLLGALLDVTPDSVTAVATDGHRMALAERARSTGLESPVQLIIPSKGVEELVKILTDGEQDVVLHLAGNHLRLDLPGDRCAFHSMLVDGKYPDYRAVAPARRNFKAKVGREALIRAAERITPVADELTQAVTLSLASGESLEVSAKNNKGDVGEERIEMEFSRDEESDAEPKISINIKYLLDSLNAIDDDGVVLSVDDGNESMLIEPAEGGSKHIIMPMKA